ncbi:MAG: carboxypeptidase-like regulatory domain-containing protein, partial [Flavitalea sp.]
MKHLRTYLVVMLLLPLSNCVFASANNGKDGTKDPILVGSVSDSYSKKPVKGVTISVTSIKDRIAKSFITDASGKFSIPTEFSSGEVTIVLEKKGYKT